MCTDKASNIMATEPEQGRKRRRASCGISLAGIIVTVIIVVTAVVVDLKACKYIVRGGVIDSNPKPHAVPMLCSKTITAITTFSEINVTYSRHF